ncbi:zinc-binding dehydrogenase [Nesterenkonia sp. HG001]|uniref:zinc-binding dehydrogenase n=1 Tax=Nesterenkonia sp. HG001 TaxID=2983207 RepID=UPI002AC6A99C|nr:zinc-binding dehydrogenase [Nesterenkonia sp. HG001]MDZ5077810.1 zinc-binding dehydrogenase [Nesterenkonia sp. HG001]
MPSSREVRALFIDAAEQAAVRRVDVPAPEAGQVRLEVHHVGICGSDLHYYYEGANGAFVVREPLIPGHELSGVVEHDPAGELAPGTPVTVHPARFGERDARFADAPHLWPGGSYLGSASTWPHTQGALSELLVVERDMVRLLPPELPVRRAVLAEPLAVSLHALTQARGAGAQLEGARVLVTGAGPIGLLAVAAAVDAGAAAVTAADVLPGPLERARGQGAQDTVDVSTDALPQSSFDVVLECSGATAAIGSVLQAVRPAGVVVQVGMVPAEPRPVDLSPFIAKEVRYVGTFRFHEEIDAAISLLARRPQIEAVITHELPPEDPEGLFSAARDSASSGKVISAPWS